MKELRHFMNFQKGSDAVARIDFSNHVPSGVDVSVTVQMCVETNYWKDFTEEVQGLLRFGVPCDKPEETK